MTLAILVGGIIKTSALTILAEIAMKALEQKDYGRLIKFTGISAITTDVVTYLKYLEKNPPLLLRLTQESFKGWKSFFKLFGVE
jgi:hypothetical protein